MEALNSLILLSITCILLNFAWKALNRAWIKPKKLEKILREKGFRGKPYRFLVGDIKETASMYEEAKSKPINFTNDIIPRVLPFLHNLVKDYGKNSYTWIGPEPAILILEPDEIREILAKNYVYQKTKDPFSRLLAEGLFSYDKDKWAKHRRLINPAFNLEKLKLMLPAFDLSCSEMLSKWDMIASEKGGFFELDVWPYILNFTSDAISRTAFGSNYEEGKKIFELQKELLQHILQCQNTPYIPGMTYLPTKGNRRTKAIVKEVQTSLLRIVNRRLNAIQAGECDDNDLLGILLKSNLKEIREQGNEEKSGMSFKEVIEECKLFYFAGQETTATLLVWTLILLGKHLDWQARARDEVHKIFPDNKKPDFEGLNPLKLMTMIFNEVLRLYPPAVWLERKIYEDTTLGNQTLPAGIQLFLPAIMLHHDESIWGDDAKEFKPERFSEGVVKATKGQHVYFPFSSGPRFCIGEKFAMLEAKMALSLILQRFSFELSPMYTHAPSTIATLQPQHGAHLLLHKLLSVFFFFFFNRCVDHRDTLTTATH